MPGMPGLLETNNTLEHPSGPEFQLVAGEGTYVLSDDLHLATPPPHPSDAPQPNNNPLATQLGPPTAGTCLSVALFAPRHTPQPRLFRTVTAQSARSNRPPSIQEEAPGDVGDGFGSPAYYSAPAAPAFGDGNPALHPAPLKGKKGGERLKPKNNIVKSNSSFVSRVIPHEALAKRLAEHSPHGLMVFANVNRAFMWLDLSSELKVENMTKVLFTKAHALCHDINDFTKSPTHLDIVLGFNTSDVIWYEPMTQKYSRLNKNGVINPSAILSIHWLPQKENLFLAAHMDGTLVVYDKGKEDADFIPEDAAAAPAENGQHHTNGNGITNGGSSPPDSTRFQIKKSVQSRNQLTNPVAVWKLTPMKINRVAFSPDGLLLAIVSEDGSLTILDYMRERVLDVYRSYYGALMCVTWSPDGRYVLTGGQDDLVSIWSMADRCLVARGVGHHSWVTDVKFDPWRCDERNYRFGSVGDDCRLLLWDFSVGMLGRPKAISSAAARNKGGSVSVQTINPLARKESHGQAASRTRSISNLERADSRDGVVGGGEKEEGEEEDMVMHPVDSKRSTAVLPPVMSKRADDHPLSWVGFEEKCILTSCRDGKFALPPCLSLCSAWIDRKWCVLRTTAYLFWNRSHTRMGPTQRKHGGWWWWWWWR